MSRFLLPLVVITMIVVVYIAILDQSVRSKHFKETTAFYQEMKDFNEFKNKGERFTADEGRLLEARIKALENDRNP